MSTMACPLGAGSGPRASVIAPSLRSSSASTRSPVQRSTCLRSILSGSQRSRSDSSSAMAEVIRAPFACPCASPTTRNCPRASGDAGSSTKPLPPAVIQFSPLASRRLAMNSGRPAASRMPGGGLGPVSPSGDPCTRPRACFAHLAASLRLASARAPRSPFQRERRASRSSPCPPRPRSCSSSAIRAACVSAPCSAPKRMVAAPCGSSGSCARREPRSVIRPSASSAPSATSVCRAAPMEAAGGGSSQPSSSGSPLPHWASASTSGARSAVSISGGS